VKDKLKEFGPNALTEKKQLPWWVNLLMHMGGFFEYMMWGGALLCFISYGLQDNKEDKGNLYLGIALAAVVLITGTFGYY